MIREARERRPLRAILRSSFPPVLIVFGCYVASEVLFVEECWTGAGIAFSTSNLLHFCAVGLGVIVACGLLVHSLLSLAKRDWRLARVRLFLLALVLSLWFVDRARWRPISEYLHRARFAECRELLSEAAEHEPPSIRLPWDHVAERFRFQGQDTYMLTSDVFNVVGLVYEPGDEFLSEVFSVEELGDGWWWYLH